ncbi:MAG: SCO family protein [Bacteroidia bacterium]|nr:SCO family protein [Bacteroidia bacterium]
MKNKKYLVGIGVVAIPLFIFSLFYFGEPKFEKLPIYGERIEPNGKDILDTIYYQIPNFKVVNQSGDTITQENLTGCIYLANFFFTSCQDVCPSMNRRLKALYDEVEDLENYNAKQAKEKGVPNKTTPIRFISFSVDPEADSIEALAEYAKRFSVTGNHWHFCTTDKKSTFNIGSGFLLPVSIEDSTIDHSQQVILVDKSNRIRGFYDSLDDAEIKRLIGEIKLLLFEYAQEEK